MSKVTLYKMNHADVNKRVSDAPLSVELDGKQGFVISDKAGKRTVFPVTVNEIMEAMVILKTSEKAKELAAHMMKYHGHDLVRVSSFLKDVAYDVKVLPNE